MYNAGRAVHPIRQTESPEDSDRIQPENRPTRSSHRSAAGHLFQKPTPAGRSRFSSQNPKKPDPTDVLRISSKKIPESGGIFQNPAGFSRFRRYFPDSGLKFPDSDFKFSDSGNKFSYFGDLSSRSIDISSKSSEISPDLARSHQIRLDLRRICRFFA